MHNHNNLYLLILFIIILIICLEKWLGFTYNSNAILVDNLLPKKYDLYQLNVLESNAKCIKTKEVNHVRTTLCIHNSSNDFTSYKISKEGIKEEELVSSFLEVLEKTKNCLAIDIGTHVGLFTLFAAKLGKQVISVEPFHDNIIRLQKGAELENIRDKIVLLKYAVSNKKNEKVLLSPHINIGQQSLFQNNFTKDMNIKDFSKYYVRTIILNDLADLIDSDPLLKNYENAILKIDIESYEPYAFQKADKLFKRLDIKMVFMEWGVLKKKIDLIKEIIKMIDFFVERNYLPYDPIENRRLNLSEWKNNWGMDVIWKKTNI